MHQDVLAKLNLSGELCRDEVGAQLNCLRDVQWEIDGGVDYLAKAVDIRLTESSERSDRGKRDK